MACAAERKTGGDEAGNRRENGQRRGYIGVDKQRLIDPSKVRETGR